MLLQWCDDGLQSLSAEGGYELIGFRAIAKCSCLHDSLTAIEDGKCIRHDRPNLLLLRFIHGHDDNAIFHHDCRRIGGIHREPWNHLGIAAPRRIHTRHITNVADGNTGAGD